MRSPSSPPPSLYNISQLGIPQRCNCASCFCCNQVLIYFTVQPHWSYTRSAVQSTVPNLIPNAPHWSPMVMMSPNDNRSWIS